MLRIHTVAAGGGSLCRFDGFRLTVGTESAGADPGPLCYGRAGAAAGSAPPGRSSAQPRDGGASEGLALTDVNLFLGRIQPERFPFPLQGAPVEAALAALERELRAAGHALSRDEIAAGFVEIANASMAQAIARRCRSARGVDPRDHVLVGFGGAGGQHVCAIARRCWDPAHDFAASLCWAALRLTGSASPTSPGTVSGMPGRRAAKRRHRARRCPRRDSSACWASFDRAGRG